MQRKFKALTVSAILLFGSAASADPLDVDLTLGTWQLSSIDIAGTSWDDSRLRFDAQTADGDSWLLQGHFYWIGSNGSFGRENFTGTLAPDRTLQLSGYEIVAPSSSIITGNYNALVDDTGTEILDGTWGDGIPGAWSASLTPAALVDSPDSLSPAVDVWDFEDISAGTYGPVSDGFVTVSAGNWRILTQDYPQNPGIFEGQWFGKGANTITIEFDSPVSQAGFGLWDPNFNGLNVTAFDTTGNVLETALGGTDFPLFPTGIGLSTFVGFAFDDEVISQIVVTPVGSDVLGIDNLYYLVPTSSPCGPVSRYQFDAIQTQADDVAFPVTISAINNSGATVTDQNHLVYLSVNNNAVVDPLAVNLNNGIWTGDVTIDGVATNARLVASRGACEGQSNSFAVTGTQYPEGTAFSGRVFGNAPVLITLRNIVNQNVETLTADADGSFAFEGLSVSNYAVTGTCGDGTRIPFERFYLPNGTRRTDNLFCESFDKTPVLIVPGFSASTSSNFNTRITPRLPKAKADPDDLVILRPSLQGVTDLKSLLDQNFLTYDAPWDWRQSLSTPFGPVLCESGEGPPAWLDYLLPRIDAALDPDGDGLPDFEKVHVVAHSMGGLMVRAYIQSPCFGARQDIDKFVMLGTPNLGSSDAYILSQGGDPVLRDDLQGGFLSFATPTVEAAYATAYGFGPNSPAVFIGGPDDAVNSQYVHFLNRQEVREFLQGFIPTARELTPTYDFLRFLPFPDPVPLSFEPNEFLLGLNTSDSITQMDRENAQKVRTRIFKSTSESDTLFQISVRGANSALDTLDIYPDGVPVGSLPDPDFADGEIDGDGTVPGFSVDGVGTHMASLVDTDCTEVGGIHRSMFGDFAECINRFLCPEDDAVCLGATRIEDNERAQQNADVPVLQVEVVSRNQLWMRSESTGQTAGVFPGTFAFTDDIENSTLNFTSGISQVSIEGTIGDQYTIVIGGVHDDEIANIEVGYENPTTGDESRVSRSVWFHGDAITLSITVNPSVDPFVTIEGVPLPENIRRDDQANVVTLLWDAPDGDDVTSYRIYGRSLTQARFELLAETSALSYTASQPLLIDEPGEIWFYFVVAVDDTGAESPFDRVITNRLALRPAFLADVTQGPAPLTVQFSDLTVGQPTQWEWDFDIDGVVDSTEQNPRHIYDQDGVYTVSLRAANANASDTKTRAGLIVVDSDPDGDGVLAGVDNCSAIANADQRDTDGDNIGNACDADLNNDCAVNFEDLGMLKAVFFSSDSNADFNGDGSVNFVDLGIMKEGFFGVPGPSGLANGCSGRVSVR